MNNVLIGNDASNVLDGRGGADVLVGGLGDDVYVFGMVCGKDVVQDSDPQFGGVDTIRFDESVSASDLSLGRSRNDLLIFLGNGENQISVTGWFEGWANQIEKIQFANGLEWGVSEINQKSLSNDVGDGYWASVTLSPGQTLMQEILINPGGFSSFPTDHDTYIVSLTAGKTYQFDQVSRSGSQLDCFLELIDWNVVAVAADDDGGGNLNSRIVFTPNSSGDYYLDASSLTGTGYYSITMTEVNPQSVIGSNIFNVDAVVEYVKAVKDPNFYCAVWSAV